MENKSDSRKSDFIELSASAAGDVLSVPKRPFDVNAVKKLHQELRGLEIGEGDHSFNFVHDFTPEQEAVAQTVVDWFDEYLEGQRPALQREEFDRILQEGRDKGYFRDNPTPHDAVGMLVKGKDSQVARKTTTRIAGVDNMPAIEVSVELYNFLITEAATRGLDQEIQRNSRVDHGGERMRNRGGNGFMIREAYKHLQTLAQAFSRIKQEQEV